MRLKHLQRQVIRNCVVWVCIGYHWLLFWLTHAFLLFHGSTKSPFLYIIQMLAFPKFSLFLNATKKETPFSTTDSPWAASLQFYPPVALSIFSGFPTCSRPSNLTPAICFLPSHKLSDLSAFSPLLTIPLFILLLSQSKAGYPEGTRLSMLCITFNRNDTMWHVAMQSGEFCIILAFRMISMGS